MQRLSDQAHIVKCFQYHPKPVPADCASNKTMLVMELMEVRSQLAHSVLICHIYALLR